MAENSLKVLKTKEKTPKPLSLDANSWSCWADSNRRPHPYQLIGNPETAGVQQFPGLFVPGK